MTQTASGCHKTEVQKRKTNFILAFDHNLLEQKYEYLLLNSVTRHQKHRNRGTGGKGVLTPGPFLHSATLLKIVHLCAVSSTVILFYSLSLIFTTIFLAVSPPLFLFGDINLFCDFTQRGMVVSCRRSGTTYRSHLQGSSSRGR